MVSDKAVGGAMVGVGVIGIIVEFIVLIFVPLANSEVKNALPGAQYWAMAIPLFLAVVGVLGIVSWIGITMINTPPPEMMEFEDFEEEELESTAKPKEEKKAAATKKAEPKKEKAKKEEKAEPASGRDLEEVDGISATIAGNLREAGYDTIDKIKGLSVEELTAVKGIGKKTAEKILADL